jgi:hypothetical protein
MLYGRDREIIVFLLSLDNIMRLTFRRRRFNTCSALLEFLIQDKPLTHTALWHAIRGRRDDERDKLILSMISRGFIVRAKGDDTYALTCIGRRRIIRFLRRTARLLRQSYERYELQPKGPRDPGS